MLCAADVHALFVFKDRVSAQCGNTYANTDVRLNWGNLEPGKSKFSIQAASLNEAYQLMQKDGLVPVPPGCLVGSVGTENYGQKYFASGYPLPDFPSQTEGLVADYQRKSRGKGDDGCCVFFGREPWQISVISGDGNKWTWPLIKRARQNPPTGLRDGENKAVKALVGPHSSSQIPKNFCSDPAKVGNIAKSKRKKKITDAKRIQFMDTKLFRISAPSKSEFDHEKKQASRDGTKDKAKGRKGNQNRKEKKRKNRIKGENESETTRVQPKKCKNKYLHLQEFLETKRQKKKTSRCTLDTSAKVTFTLTNISGSYDHDDVDDDSDDEDDRGEDKNND